MKISTASRAALAALIALVGALALVLAAPLAAQATTDAGGGGSNECHSYPSKFVKTGSTIIGVMTLDCASSWEILRVGVVIDRAAGGGAKAHTFYQKPMIECSKRKVCVATYGITDVSGTQTYRLTNEPQGTHVSTGLGWSGTKGASGTGEMFCSGGDYKGILCSSQNKQF